ncbi:hypothetical protein [Carnobacterium mobile]|uniref:hypothetical protein n=1 Tax=Carnobacterium mobile TaxID=2750 RepID=UPI0005517FE7|nr:hypothetical protein [Carnobacterium mobile]
MKKVPWFQKTPIVVLTSFLGSLICFASIAALLGVKNTDKLNEKYYDHPNEPLFLSEELKNRKESKK